MRKLKLLTFLSVVLVLISGATSAQNLKIYCIDVNQGDATLIVTPNGKSILIDCGPPSAGVADSVFDVIANKANLSSIDYFICTHYHLDHIGAFQDLHNKLNAANIEIDNYYDRGYDYFKDDGSVPTTGFYNEYVTTIGSKRTKILPGQTIDIDNTVGIECIVGCGITNGET